MAETGKVSLFSVVNDAPDAPLARGEFDRSKLGAIVGDTGLVALAAIAAHYRIACDPAQMSHDLPLGEQPANGEHIVRAARKIGLKATILTKQGIKRLKTVPLPAIVGLIDGSFGVITHRSSDGQLRFVNPLARSQLVETAEEFANRWSGHIVLVTRRAGGAGIDPRKFEFSWFIPSI